MRALDLEPIGARVLRREVDRRRLEDDVLRTEMERGVGRRELVGELGEDPVPVGTAATAEDLPQRRQVGRVLDRHDRLVVEPLESRGDVTDRGPWVSTRAMTRSWSSASTIWARP